jgi:hypothetical protein
MIPELLVEVDGQQVHIRPTIEQCKAVERIGGMPMGKMSQWDLVALFAYVEVVGSAGTQADVDAWSAAVQLRAQGFRTPPDPTWPEP